MADPITSPEATAVTNSTPNPPDSIAQPKQLDPSPSVSANLNQNPNPTAPPPPAILTPPPPPIQQYFRPVAPQFTPLAYQTPPPGVIIASAPTLGNGAQPQVPGMPPSYAIAGQPVRYAQPMPNGYPAIPQGAMPPPGVMYYSSPYAPMIRPTFPPRQLVGVMPQLARPPVVGIRGPIMPPVVRLPVIPSVVPTEKPHTTVYVGKISTTVENDFMLSLLQLCGPVKNWKRPQDPTGTLKGFGFCEFESAEGVLRALRLLNKLSVDGQELMLNVNQTTREYLECYTEKKVERSSTTKEAEGTDKAELTASGADTDEFVKSSLESLNTSTDNHKKGDGEKLNKEDSVATNFGLVTDEDREADSKALEKLRGLIEERLKSKPLPPPPPPPAPKTLVDGPGNSNSEQPSGSKDRDSDGDVAKNDYDDKNDEEKTADSKPPSENRGEPGSPDRSRKRDRSKDRDRDLKREKERELERYEREREQERSKREKERDYKSREDDRRYKAREKEWEAREREKDQWRKREREREKERAQERKWGIMDQEREIDDGHGKKRKYKTSDEERKRRQREKEEDLVDRLREEEEIAEAKTRADEEQKKTLHEALNIISGQPVNGHEKVVLPNETSFKDQDKAVDQTLDCNPVHEIYEDEGGLHNGIAEESVMPSTASDAQQNSNAPARKLGFGLSGSGKRAAVPSVFNEDEDEDSRKEKKMKPLVPIDYSTEEQQAVQPSISEGPNANVVAAAEFVKHISTGSSKEQKPDVEKEKGRRSHERSSKRDRDRHEEHTHSTREESRKDNFDKERGNKVKTPENQKLLAAKHLIDTIPKTKDELFSYEINWAIYDKNALHEKMRPWISKKIEEFLGEEEVTLVDYIVSSTQDHVDAGEMLERLQAILDDEAEMFVLKMWRMLIFEIKKVETGLPPPKSRT